MSKDNILCLKAASLKCFFNVVNEISDMQSLTSLSQPPQRSMCSALFDVKRLWAAFQLTVCVTATVTRAHRWVSPAFHPQNTDVTHHSAPNCSEKWLHVTATKWLLGSTHFISIRSIWNPSKTFIFLVHGVGWAHSIWRALEFTSQKWPYNITLCPSRLFFLSPPPQAHFFSLQLNKHRAFSRDLTIFVLYQ